MGLIIRIGTLVREKNICKFKWTSLTRYSRNVMNKKTFACSTFLFYSEHRLCPELE